MGIALMVMGAGCDDARLAFIETISGGGDSEVWPIAAGDNQAAGPERLGDISGAMHRVRYAMFDRWTPFLLTGDLETGAPPVGLQLPRVADDVSDVTIDVRRTATTWQSFRVYDRGECSLLPAARLAGGGTGGLRWDHANPRRQ